MSTPVSQVFHFLLRLANAAAERIQLAGREHKLLENVLHVMTACVTMMHNQLDRHRASVTATQLQVSRLEPKLSWSYVVESANEMTA